MDGKEHLVKKAYFLNNTKVITSKINEDKSRKKRGDNPHVQGREISEIDMRHFLIKYPEVFTDLIFISVLTLPLELCAGTDCKGNIFGEVEDNSDIGSVSDNISCDKELQAPLSQHTVD